MSEKNLVPTRKVGSGALAGAVVVLVIKTLNDGFGYELDAETASALTVIVTVLTGYLTPNATPQERSE